MAYPKQTWDTSSYVNPTRMNHIEDGIKSAVDGMTNIYIEGSTNNTGSTIASGYYFYLNGTLVRAKQAIQNGGDFTLNTNYEVVTVGAINEVNQDLRNAKIIKTNTRDSGGITFNCRYIEYGNIVVVNMIINLYISADNATQLTSSPLPTAIATTILSAFNSSYEEKSIRIADGHVYPNQTWVSGTYNVSGSYIKS